MGMSMALSVALPKSLKLLTLIPFSLTIRLSRRVPLHLSKTANWRSGARRRIPPLRAVSQQKSPASVSRM